MARQRTTPAFAGFEWAIAWRYLRARRAEGGVSVMTWISLIGIALAVFALIATMAVRSGFRADFTATILGVNAHVTIYETNYTEAGVRRGITSYEEMVANVAAVEGVTRVAPIIRGQVMASSTARNTGVEVFGEMLEDLRTLPLVANPETFSGSLDDFGEGGIAIGSGVARTLGVRVGDFVTLTSPDGVKMAFGTAPRINDYEVAYIFQVGRSDIDRTRIYLPFEEAQSFFNREGMADELEVAVANADAVDEMRLMLIQAAGSRVVIWTWRDASGAFLRALDVEDNVMFILMSILVLIAAMNIISGLIMLVKNKTRDIGILRTMGLTQGSIMRIFFISGASIGLVGTALGVLMGCLFAIYIDPVFACVDGGMGGGVWDPNVRYLSRLPAKLELRDVMSAVTLSLSLSFIITIFPARRAANMDPVEALRNE
ncbi:MAG: lipoprotein-releasing ABC transporter permease subunit [Paracoccaceae bacterium]